MDTKLTIWRTGFKGSLKDLWHKAAQFLVQKTTLLPQGYQTDPFHMYAGTFFFIVAHSVKDYFLRLVFHASTLLGVIDFNYCSLSFSYPVTPTGVCVQPGWELQPSLRADSCTHIQALSFP